MIGGRCVIDDLFENEPRYRCSWYFKKAEDAAAFFRDFLKNLRACSTSTPSVNESGDYQWATFADGSHEFKLDKDYGSRVWEVQFSYQ
jgi:hypothetical protein